jgi:hypothetical protein
MRRSLIFSLGLLLALPAWTRSPVVERVDPPSWWIGLPPPMLLLQGEGLEGAKVTTTAPGIRVERVEEGLNGRYLFVWLAVTRYARPGTVTLHITTDRGRADLAVSLAALPRHDRGGMTEGDILLRMDPSSGETSSERLARFRSLGVTAYLLAAPYPVPMALPRAVSMDGKTPVADFYPGRDAADTLTGLAGFSRAVHEAGAKLVLSVEADHVSATHAWVTAPPHERWISGTREHHLSASGDLAALADPHAPAARTRPLLEGWLDESLADLNTQDPWVAAYLRQQMLWWAVQSGADALRLEDMAHVQRRFWKDFHEEAARALPHLALIGDVPGADAAVVASFAGGRTHLGVDTGVSTMMDAPLADALRDAVQHHRGAARMEAVFRQDWLYASPATLVLPAPAMDDAESAALAARVALLLPRVPLLPSSMLEPPFDRASVPLLRLRHKHPALQGGAMYHLYADDTVFTFGRDHLAGNTAGFGRSTRPEHLLILVNVGDAERRLRLDVQDTPLMTAMEMREVLPAGTARVAEGKIEVAIPARSVAIWDVRCGCEVEDSLTPAPPP